MPRGIGPLRAPDRSAFHKGGILGMRASPLARPIIFLQSQNQCEHVLPTMYSRME